MCMLLVSILELQVLKDDSKNVKAYFRRGQVRRPSPERERGVWGEPSCALYKIVVWYIPLFILV